MNRVDLTPPVVVFDRPPAGLVVTAGSATFTAHASDPALADGTPGSGVESVRFCFTPANPLQPVTCSWANPTAAGTWVTSDDLPSGLYDVNVSGQNIAGNIAAAWPSQLTVVNATPLGGGDQSPRSGRLDGPRRPPPTRLAHPEAQGPRSTATFSILH